MRNPCLFDGGRVFHFCLPIIAFRHEQVMRHGDMKVSLTHLRGLEVEELDVEDFINCILVKQTTYL